MNLFTMPPIEDADVMGRIIILILIYVVAIKSSKKKKKKSSAKQDWEQLQRPAAKADTKKKPARQGPRRSDARREAARGQRAALERQPMATQLQMELEAAGEGDDPCHEGDLHPARPGIRFASVSQEGMTLAGEGEDPCHTGEAPRHETSPVYDSPILTDGHDDSQSLARQVLSGVIMSEVLKRPQERRMERKLRGHA